MAEVMLLFWEIKYYFATMMFSRVFLALNGLMQNKQCKDPPTSLKKKKSFHSEHM